MPSYAQYKDPSDTTRTPSPSIWANCPTLEIQHDPAAGYHFFDDFHNWEAQAAGATAIYYSDYYIDADTGVIMAPLANTDFGTIYTTVTDTAMDGVVVAHGVNAGFARMGTDPGDEVWFEAKFNVDSITDDENCFFFGLYGYVSVVPSANATLADTTGLMNTTEDFVGFYNNGVTDTGGGPVLECVYQEGSATKVDVGDAITTMVVGTNYKVGLHYKGGPWHDGTTDYTGKLDYYVDGAIVQTLGTTSSLSFPDTNHMCMLFAFKDIDGGSNAIDIDWWRVAAVGGNT
jgi:hypothetical protein